MKFKLNLIQASLLAAMTVASAGASAVHFPDFTVDPDSVAGGSTFVADKLTGGYVEIVTFDRLAANTFEVSILWNAGQYFANDGVTALPAGFAGGTGLGSDHLIYAFMMGSGTYIPTAGGGADFTFTSGGSLNLWLDYDGSSIASFLAPTTGNLPWTTASLDTLIATGAVTGGTGTLTPLLSSCGPHPLNPTGSGINCGSFGTTTSFVLTAAGSDYFIAPVPFYEVSFQSGQLNNFEVAGTQTINGSLDVVFNRVPEPSSIALVGLGLIGLAAGLRRRKQA